MDLSHPPDDLPPDELLAAREGTGVGFPAALAAHARARGGQGAFEDALAWCSSPQALQRLLGLELLGALAAPGSPVAPPGTRELLVEQAGRVTAEPEEELRWVAAKVLGHGGHGALDPLLVLAADPAADVRWQAVASLPLVAGTPPQDAAVDALITAAGDADEEVRDQAVFALALQLEVDTPALREVLAAHLHDEREDTAAQAARGLALRHDERVLGVLLARLGGDDPEVAAELDLTWVEAAADLGDVRAVPALRHLRALPGVEHLAGAVDEALDVLGG